MVYLVLLVSVGGYVAFGLILLVVVVYNLMFVMIVVCFDWWVWGGGLGFWVVVWDFWCLYWFLGFILHVCGLDGVGII